MRPTNGRDIPMRTGARNVLTQRELVLASLAYVSPRKRSDAIDERPQFRGIRR